MDIALFNRIVLLPAAGLLPVKMDSLNARAMVLAICLQESGLVARTQAGGPARGYPQFELNGVIAVLTHPSTSDVAGRVCTALDISFDNSVSVHTAIAYNDILAICFARLLLWTLPQALPARDNPDQGWAQYVEAWRPGAPRRSTWNGFYEAAWKAIDLMELYEP